MFWGMDTDQVRRHGRRLDAAAGDVAVLRERLDAAVGGAAWAGPDAETLRARWAALSAAVFTGLSAQLHALSGELRREAERQEVVSAAMAGGVGTTTADGAGAAAGTTTADGPDPAPAAGPGGTEAPDPAELARLLGADLDGIDQARSDIGHVGEQLSDWVTGERVPSLAELGAGLLLAAGSTAVAPVELFTDTGFLDPRTEITVHGITAVPGPSTPQDLADLLLANDQARDASVGVHDQIAAGQIRIRTVHSDSGAERFIVHAPPTSGAEIWEADAWGAQGSSAGWDSNLRAMSGQGSAAMADIRAALAAADVPSGAQLMIVGHSQGGLTAAQLIADPSFNSADGAPGTYDVTHSFSVGAPVETVLPAQASTRVLNVTHDPGWAPSADVLGIAVPGSLPVRPPDPVPALDLDGYRLDGSRPSAPNVQEVRLETPPQAYDLHGPLEGAHESVLATARGPDPTGGYYGSLRARTDAHPVLSGLQADLTGSYLGTGVTVVEDRIVEVGRKDLR